MAVRNRRKADWNKLHSSLKDTYLAHGHTRMAAVLSSFSDRKETICRRLAVVCDADVARIAKELKGPGAKIRPVAR